MKQFEDKAELENMLGKDIVIISYPSAWGGQFTERKCWMATKNGEVDDYSLKKHLIKDAEEHKEKWVVIRYHKNGKISITATNIKIVSVKKGDK